MAVPANVSPFYTFASYSDDLLLHSPTVAQALASPAAAATVAIPATEPRHDTLSLLFSPCPPSPAWSACCTKAVKFFKIESALKQQQQQVMVLEPLSIHRGNLSNPSHGLSSEGLMRTEVDRCHLMLPWLVSDMQFSSLAHVLYEQEPSASGHDGSTSAGIVKKIVDGSPVASQASSRVLNTMPSAPTQKQESPGRDSYHVNTGYAIRSLREELPSMFYKDLNYEFYREDIVFRDPLSIFHGIDNYKHIFRALRFHGQLFFKAIWVEVLSVWQPSEGVITVRWTVRGIPRVPWEAQGRFDGTSKYKLDKDGKIYEHKVDNVVNNSPPKFESVTVMDLARVAGMHTTPTPTFFRVL